MASPRQQRSPQQPAATSTPKAPGAPGVPTEAGGEQATTQGWLTPEQVRAASAGNGPANRLPWVLVAMLTALSLGLAAILGLQSRELSRLRQQATTVATPAPGAAATQQSQQAQQPQQANTPNPQAVEIMKALPHRKDGDPTAMGTVDAPVVMIVWSDFRCPFCSVWARQTLPQLQPYVDSGSLRIEHRDLVLFGDQSLNTAKASRAAGLQGKYWEFYKAVHDVAPTSGHPEITAADLTKFAKTAGVPDMAKFEADLKSAEVAQAVQTDVTEAQKLGLSGTPFFVINTTPLSGAQPANVFIQTIEANGGKR